MRGQRDSGGRRPVPTGEPERGDSVDELLRYVHFDPEQMLDSYLRRLRAQHVGEAFIDSYYRELKAGLHGYTYLKGLSRAFPAAPCETVFFYIEPESFRVVGTCLRCPGCLPRPVPYCGRGCVRTVLEEGNAMTMIENLHGMLERGIDTALLRYSLGAELLKIGNADAAITHLREAISVSMPNIPRPGKCWARPWPSRAIMTRAVDVLVRVSRSPSDAGISRRQKEMGVFRKRSQRVLDNPAD